MLSEDSTPTGKDLGTGHRLGGLCEGPMVHKQDQLSGFGFVFSLFHPQEFDKQLNISGRSQKKLSANMREYSGERAVV